MSRKISCTRILLEGITSYAIQGINLREKVEGYVRSNLSNGVRGRISNLKNGQVEIIFCGKPSELNKLSDYLYKSITINKDGKEVNVVKKLEPYKMEIKSDTFSGFSVERSDDLSEMVWALRGPGMRFEEATDALDRIDKTIQKRDENAAIGKLLTLRDELIHNWDLLSNIEMSKRPESVVGVRERINKVALESNIANPAVPDTEFIIPVGEVYSELTSGRISSNTNILTKIKSLVKLTEKLLKTKGITI
jgi:acylphosphatase